MSVWERKAELTDILLVKNEEETGRRKEQTTMKKEKG
jgi:hypothetical protein